jgi:hypothetical protein
LTSCKKCKEEVECFDGRSAPESGDAVEEAVDVSDMDLSVGCVHHSRSDLYSMCKSKGY